MVPGRGGEEVDGEERPGEVECGKRRTAAREIWRWRDGRKVVPDTKEVPSGLRDRVGDFIVERMTHSLLLILSASCQWERPLEPAIDSSLKSR